ncbi:MAG: hypothetical protein J4O09_07855 [Chloroflexi bacterium]|nr:hypothetical protein [Chloroflexota bacterium]
MRCRRCRSPRLLQLDKKLPQDNSVFRCQECGFLFSPATGQAGNPSVMGAETRASRTVAVRSGYQTGK